MATHLSHAGSGPDPCRDPGKGTSTGKLEEQKPPDQQPVEGEEEENELLPQGDKPIVKPDNWAGG
jgi:hypothetical protein